MQAASPALGCMATDPRAHYSQGAKLWRRQATQEYLSPSEDVVGFPA
ncbi:hypothetical protein ACFWWA_17410 [Streptomyces goshikiensis]